MGKNLQVFYFKIKKVWNFCDKNSWNCVRWGQIFQSMYLHTTQNGVSKHNFTVQTYLIKLCLYKNYNLLCIVICC